MDSLVNLIIGIAWPVALVWIAYLFKGEVQSLLHRISQFKYKDVEAKFDRDLAEAEAKVTELEKPPNPDLLAPDSEVASRLELLRRIADTSPRAAILEAWVIVEDSASKSGFIQGSTVPRVNSHLFVEHLVQRGKLPKGSDSLLAQMRKLRNQAAHLPDFSINRDEADRYLELAARMSELIEAAKWYSINCRDCGAEMKVHRDWDNPPKICKLCRVGKDKS